MRLKKFIKDQSEIDDQIERVAYIGNFPIMLKWTLRNPVDEADSGSVRRVAYGELKDMRQNKALNFYEDQFNASQFGYEGQTRKSIDKYQTTVELIESDMDKLIPELERLNFRIVNDRLADKAQSFTSGYQLRTATPEF